MLVGLFKQVAESDQLVPVQLELLVHLKELGVLDVALGQRQLFLLLGQLRFLLLDLFLQ